MLSNASPAAVGGLAALMLALVIVSLPRFNRQDWLIGAWTAGGRNAAVHLADAQAYTDTVRWIRAEAGSAAASRDELRAPFSWRLLTPLLAAALPFDAMTSLNVVNLLLLAGTMLLLYRLQRQLAISERGALLGCACFTVSFPTFYYTTIGNVDPALLFAVAACLVLIHAGRHLAAALAIGCGCLAKEGVILVAPSLAVATWQARRSWRPVVAHTAVALASWAILYYVVRTSMPISNHDWWPWRMSAARLFSNAWRAESWITLGLSAATLALPFAFAAAAGARGLRRPLVAPEQLPLWTGLAASLAYYGYSWLAVHVDGRMFWPVYLFALPLAVYLSAPAPRAGTGRGFPRPRCPASITSFMRVMRGSATTSSGSTCTTLRLNLHPVFRARKW